MDYADVTLHSCAHVIYIMLGTNDTSISIIFKKRKKRMKMKIHETVHLRCLHFVVCRQNIYIPGERIV